ncbi:unnamed protein product [Ectocarpus sp. 4 AP-2014]
MCRACSRAAPAVCSCIAGVRCRAIFVRDTSFFNDLDFSLFPRDHLGGDTAIRGSSLRCHSFGRCLYLVLLLSVVPFFFKQPIPLIWRTRTLRCSECSQKNSAATLPESDWLEELRWLRFGTGALSYDLVNLSRPSVHVSCAQPGWNGGFCSHGILCKYKSATHHHEWWGSLLFCLKSRTAGHGQDVIRPRPDYPCCR